MFEQADLGDARNAVLDWALRGGIAAVFILFGSEKFSSDPGSHWVKLFQEIGAGQWFRYFTGVVEVLGGVLVLVPWTVRIGLALLARTMACAALIVAFEIGRPGDSVFSAAFFIGLTVFGWSRRTR